MSTNNQLGKEFTEILCTGEVPVWVTEAAYLWVSLHTDDPDEGDQTTYEVDYTGYARQSIARDPAKWDITIGGAKNTEVVTFPAPTGGDGDEVRYVGVGLEETGAGTMLITSNVLDPVYTIAIDEPITIPINGLWIRER